MKKAIIMNALFVLIILSFMAFAVRIDFFFPEANTDLTAGDIPKAADIDTSGGTNPGAAIDFVEFGNYRCGFCQVANEEVKKIAEEYGEEMNFVYKHVPSDDLSYSAAVAAECSKEQGMFLDFHDRLYEDDIMSETDITERAAEIGLDIDDMFECMGKDKAKEKIQNDMDEANANNLHGTPIFVINGDVLIGYQDYASLKQAIEEQLDPEAIAEGILGGKG